MRLRKSGSRGFSLLELVIVIAILGILVLIAKPAWDTSRKRTRETILMTNLHRIRDAITTHVADKGKLPDSLEALVTAGYFGQIPEDPIAKTRTWSPEFGKLPGSNALSEAGVLDVHSTSDALAIDGTPYNTW
jgi:general secretion pathway protein G